MKKIPVTYPAVSWFLILILLGLASCSHPSQSTPESILKGALGDTLDRKLTPLIEQIMRGYDLPGVAIGIVKENEIVYSKAFGYSNIDTREALTIESLFHMASISKTFVATAIMQLVEQGKIELDSSVIYYLPYFKLLGGPYEKITIKHMLNHISGMPDVRSNKWDNPVYDPQALELNVRRMAAEIMIANPGDHFSYSSLAFDCLGDLIAKVSGLTFEKFVKKRILDPAGMEESTFLKPEHLPDHWASPHIRILSSKPWESYPYSRIHGPSSTLHSNVVEMCNWAMANMNYGIYGKKRILEASSYDLLWKPWFPDVLGSHVGLSWFIKEYRNEESIEHSGGDTGFRTDFMMIPEKSLAVVVLANLYPAPVKEIKQMAMDMLLGFEPQIIKIPASIPVLRELEVHGVQSAIELWESMKMNQPDKYDFSPQHFNMLLDAMHMDLVEDAITLSQLCVKILPLDIIIAIKNEAEWIRNTNRENRAAPAILKVIQNNS